MAELLKDDFSPKRPITQVPTAWFNRVGKILNGIVQGLGISIKKEGTDTAGWEIGLDVETARKALGVPNICPNKVVKDANGRGDGEEQIANRHPVNVEFIPDNETPQQKLAREIADIGVSELSARADHKHRIETADSANTLQKDGQGDGGAGDLGKENTVARSDHSHPLNVSDKNPKDISGKNAETGTAKEYARADHVHKMPSGYFTGTRIVVYGARIDDSSYMSYLKTKRETYENGLLKTSVEGPEIRVV